MAVFQKSDGIHIIDKISVLSTEGEGMIIESLASQNKDMLRDMVIIAYKVLREEVCKCDACTKNLDVDYDNWHPEKSENYNDVWKIVELLEHFGYPSYDWDSVLYTFYLEAGDVLVKMDGISFSQSVCNVLVEYYAFRNRKQTKNDK